MYTTQHTHAPHVAVAYTQHTYLHAHTCTNEQRTHAHTSVVHTHSAGFIPNNLPLNTAPYAAQSSDASSSALASNASSFFGLRQSRAK